MTSLVEEARWAKLRDALTERLKSWEVPHANEKAHGIVWDLRRSGWRVPLPKDSYPPPRTGRALRPEAVRIHAEECRSAIRNNQNVE